MKSNNDRVQPNILKESSSQHRENGGDIKKFLDSAHDPSRVNIKRQNDAAII